MARVGPQAADDASVPAPATPPALELRAIGKRFGRLQANDAISLVLGAGEVLALLGENGAGKSTLVSILFGHYVADSGAISVFGRPLPPGQPRAALDAGIGMVHQHFTLADNLTVLDNVMLGTEPLTRLRSRRDAAQSRLVDLAGRFGLAVAPAARVGSLSVGERQRVEIIKALYRGARILILDEPTAVLTPPEVGTLFATLRRLVAGGMSVIFISHKLDEVLAVSDRIAVLRAGRLVAEVATRDADKTLLARTMVGRDVVPPARHSQRKDALALRLRGAGLRADPMLGRPRLSDIDLEVHAGEVVAIAGVAGNGQGELAEVLFGLRALDAGQLQVDSRALPPRASAFVRAGVARIPEDRQAVGAIGDFSLWENAVLERHAQRPFARFGLLRRARAMAFARRVVERFDVRGAEGRRGRAGIDIDLELPMRQLSGGNMQKLILGRSLSGVGRYAVLPPLIVAHRPTWGLDVGAVADIHQRLLDACAGGSALLLISEDLDEILALADRIAVMHQGRLTPARPAAEWTLAELGLAMAGQAH